MGNTIAPVKGINDCAGPEITNEEIKKLTYTGFTKEELEAMGEIKDDKKRSSKSLTSLKNIPRK